MREFPERTKLFGQFEVELTIAQKNAFHEYVCTLAEWDEFLLLNDKLELLKMLVTADVETIHNAQHFLDVRLQIRTLERKFFFIAKAWVAENVKEEKE